MGAETASFGVRIRLITNYDLKNEEDRYIVLSLVAADYNLWKGGGRPTESHSVYRRR